MLLLRQLLTTLSVTCHLITFGCSAIPKGCTSSVVDLQSAGRCGVRSWYQKNTPGTSFKKKPLNKSYCFPKTESSSLPRPWHSNTPETKALAKALCLSSILWIKAPKSTLSYILYICRYLIMLTTPVNNKTMEIHLERNHQKRQQKASIGH